MGFEKVMHNELIVHLNIYNILVQEQFGFRKKSTEQTMYNLTNEILTSYQQQIYGG
jgi:hypothetical protein